MGHGMPAVRAIAPAAGQTPCSDAQKSVNSGTATRPRSAIRAPDRWARGTGRSGFRRRRQWAGTAAGRSSCPVVSKHVPHHDAGFTVALLGDDVGQSVAQQPSTVAVR